LQNTAPPTCIFNAIVWSLNPKRRKNEKGYVETCNNQQAEKTAAISQCWEGLINKKNSPTATALSLTLHRITGSKEATSLLHTFEASKVYLETGIFKVNFIMHCQ
jgi:hypothetical protein